MSSENKLKVFNLIRKHGPISRAEIAKLTKLSAPTVGRCVNYLIKKKFSQRDRSWRKFRGKKTYSCRSVKRLMFYHWC
ncbi:winged helix-turn-helix domain-containing protein [Dictyoglomus thermophilum]|uniref:winged helix-turn-helix domain-containing protein n=1 Tax=Dictyoglomus thermophilum TaxID=14 RepID=UPI0037098DDD